MVMDDDVVDDDDANSILSSLTMRSSSLSVRPWNA